MPFYKRVGDNQPPVIIDADSEGAIPLAQLMLKADKGIEEAAITDEMKRTGYRVRQIRLAQRPIFSVDYFPGMEIAPRQIVKMPDGSLIKKSVAIDGKGVLTEKWEPASESPEPSWEDKEIRLDEVIFDVPPQKQQLVY